MRISFLRLPVLMAAVSLLAGAAQQNGSFPVVPSMEESLQQQRASIDRQRQAIQQQMGEGSPVTVRPAARFIAPLPVWNPPLRPASLPFAAQTWNPPDCPALQAGKVTELVSAAAERQSLDPALLRAVMRKESAFRPCAVSPKGALGLMQLMPGTAFDLHVADAFDPEQNVQAGAKYLKQLLGRYNGDLRLALVGYNAGPRRADQASDSPYPVETQDYVASILTSLGIGGPARETASDAAKPLLSFDMNAASEQPEP